MSLEHKPSAFDPVTLDTEHVKVRPLSAVTPEQLADGLLYENSFHALNSGIKTLADIERMYTNYVTVSERKIGNALVFLSKDEKSVLGMTNFMSVEPANGMIEIGGTWIGQKWQRSYVNTETKLTLLQYAFEVLKLNRVEFRIDSENVVSRRAVQRLGFHYDGFLPRRKPNRMGEIRDYVFYSVTDKSWPSVKNHILELLEKTKSKNYSIIQGAGALQKSGDHEAAFQKVTAAIAVDPQCPDLQYLAGCLCDTHRTETEAVPFYVEALRLGLKGKDRRDCFLGLASTYRTLGQYAESKKTFEQGIKDFPNYRPYEVFLALTEFNLKNPERAIELLLNVILETTQDQEILSYQRALKFYSTRLSETFQ